MKGYAAALALGAVSLIGACTTPPATDAPSSSSTPEVPVTSTTTASPPSTAGSQSTTSSGQAQIPEAARANTPQGAEAFTRYFLDEVNHGYNSMTAEPFTALSVSNCQACTIMKSSIEEWKQKNYHYVGDFITPTVVAISAFPNDSSAKVLVVSNTKESRLLNEGNVVVKMFPAENANSLVSLRFSNGQWGATEIKAAG